MSIKFFSNSQPMLNAEVGSIVQLSVEDGFRYKLKCSVVSKPDSATYELKVVTVFDADNGSEVTGGAILEEFLGKTLKVSREMVFLAA